MINQQILLDNFAYCNGDLVRKVSARKRYAKQNLTEYLCTVFSGKTYRTHRLIFLYHYGYLPKQIDHIDGNKFNNNIENLRECLPCHNSQNIGIKKNNNSGLKGIVWENNRRTWRVRVNSHGKNVYSGRFKDLELAELVAIEARNKYHKEFANHGV